MKRIIYILVLLFASNNIQSQGCLKADIMLVVDMSGSVTNDQHFIKSALDDFIDRFELSEEGVKIGLIYFNESVHLKSNLTSDKKRLKRKTTSPEMSIVLGGLTYLANALDIASVELLEGRRDSNKVIILISDARVDDKEDCLIMSSDMMEIFDIFVIGLLIDNNVSQEGFMRKISNKVYVSDYSGLSEEMKQLDICM